MKTFKQFLNEKAIGQKPQYESLDVNMALDVLNSRCKNALWMLHKDCPIYRGERSPDVFAVLKKHGFATVDTTATIRASQNTSNWFTVIFDNHPDRQHFPKRSASFICTTDKSYAEYYSTYIYPHGRPVLRIIPADDAKIGLVNQEDMWNTEITMFGSSTSVDLFNKCFSRIFPGVASWDKIVQFDKLLKDGQKSALQRFQKGFSLNEAELKKYSPIFLEQILKAYSAEKTKHTVATTATMPHNKKGEVWVGGKIIIINDALWQQLRSAL